MWHLPSTSTGTTTKLSWLGTLHLWPLDQLQRDRWGRSSFPPPTTSSSPPHLALLFLPSRLFQHMQCKPMQSSSMCLMGIAQVLSNFYNNRGCFTQPKKIHRPNPKVQHPVASCLFGSLFRWCFFRLPQPPRGLFVPPPRNNTFRWNLRSQNPIQHITSHLFRERMNYIRRFNKYGMSVKDGNNNNLIDIFYLRFQMMNCFIFYVSFISVYIEKLCCMLFHRGWNVNDQSEYFSIVYPLTEANIQEYKRMQNYK